ncbi:MAG TPA: alpha/beta hydrolase [Holophagaceae bacterium]|nr:alpha/beta hydrolase [Holophagaceae bacterium]
MSRLRRLLLGLAALLLMLGAVGHRLLYPGLPFMKALQGPEATQSTFTVENHRAMTGDRAVPLRVYRPTVKPDRAILVLHGVHTLGFDEPRLVRFAHELVRAGYLVATPDLEDLKTYDLAPRTVDDIEAAALAFLDAPGLRASDLPHRPTLMGISFSGGLGLCAAGRPALAGRLGGVFAFGGHGNLDRVLAYLATGQLPDGEILAPHLYGQAVLARRLADRLVPPTQVEALRGALALFLQERGAEFQTAAQHLAPEAKAVADLCLRWDAPGLSARLAPLAKGLHADPRLSPELNPRPDCPIYLLHGSGDNVIPPSETRALARWAAQQGPTTALVTDLIRHVELEHQPKARPSLLETWKLLRLLSEFLRR